MTYHACNFTGQWNHLASEGGPPCRTAFPLPIQALADAFTVEGTGRVAPLTNDYQGLIQTGPRHYESVEAIDIVIENDNGTRYACRARKDIGNGQEWEIVSSVAGDVGVFSNNASSGIRQANNPWSRPWGQIFFDGNALAAFDDGAAFVPEDIIEGVMWLTNCADGMGLSRYAEFVDIPPDTSTNQAQALDRLNRLHRNASGRYTLGTRSDGSVAYVHNCDFALMPGSRRIFLRSSDIGNQNEQIPPNIESNTPGHFRFFPGAFFRRSSYLRNVFSTNWGVDGYSIIGQNNEYQPFQLSQVVRAPTKSAWRVLVDGTVHEIWVDHPMGSDYRTAVEIYNGVWGPIIQTNEAVLNALSIPGPYDRENVPTADTVEGLLHRFQYLQYAELLAVTDGSADITEDYTQGNTGSVG